MTDEQIKNSLKDKINQSYNEYIRKVERYVNALKALGENVSINPPLTKPETPTGTVKGGFSIGFTMKQKITQALKNAGKPLTSRQIMDAINKEFPDRTYDFNAFSGNFSQTWRKAGVKKYERPDEPIEFRVVYGLDKWFTTSGDLKQEYKDLL